MYWFSFLQRQLCIFTDSAPAGIDAPTVETAGFTPFSYVTIESGDHATVTVSPTWLNATGATPTDVTLFRAANGSWSAVTTQQLATTDDGLRFGANVSDGIYAVGVVRPDIGVTDLAVETQRVNAGEPITVSVSITNDGRVSGSHDVQLEIAESVVATRNVPISAGTTEEITLSHTMTAGGSYAVRVDNLTADVVVTAAANRTTTTEAEQGVTTEPAATTEDSSPGVPGFGVSTALVALLAAALIAIRNR